MKSYRISTNRWAKNIDGEGARLYGGRWNSIGKALVYSSENISLAMLEVLANANKNILKISFTCTQLLFPDEIWNKRKTFTTDMLPKNWNMFPHQESCKLSGDDWINSCQSLILEVPSAANHLENNVLINPKHEDIGEVKIGECFELNFSKRIYSFS